MSARVFADGTTNLTVLDDLGRVKFSVDARGVTSAPGYNAAGQRTSLTNAWGTAQQAVYRSGFDENGNGIWSLQPDGTGTTNVFDALNRHSGNRLRRRHEKVHWLQCRRPECRRDQPGRHYHLVRQRWRGQTQQRDERIWHNQPGGDALRQRRSGEHRCQIDALSRTNGFRLQSAGPAHLAQLPGGQIESWGFDLAGNEIRHTNFNGAVITNQFDVMNRCTNQTSVGYFASFAFSPTGQRTNMVDQSGSDQLPV